MPPLHRSHGREHLEPERHDELSIGVPAPATVLADAGDQRRPDGTFAPGSSVFAAKGGAAKKGRTAL